MKSKWQTEIQISLNKILSANLTRATNKFELQVTGIISPLPTIVDMSHSAVGQGPFSVVGHSVPPVSVRGVAPI